MLNLAKRDHSLVNAGHVKTTSRNIKWDLFHILASG